MSAKSSADRPRLGRGLSSLISVSELPVEAAAPVRTPPRAAAAPESGTPPAGPVPPGSLFVMLDIDTIVPNPHQPRRSMNEAGLSELAASIKSAGVIQPVIVRRTEDGSIQLIAGERRWRAARKAGVKQIPAIVREVDGFTQAQLALIENIQREDLNPIDRAIGYQTLVDQLGLTQNELAGRLGEDRGTISNYLRLLDLSPPVQDLVRDGRLKLSHAKLLVAIPDAKEQLRVAQLVITQDLNLRNLERLITGSGSTSVKKGRIAAGNSLHLADLEKKIAGQLGLRVNVRTMPKNASKGRVVIHYGNLDQFDELMSRLGIKLED